MSRKEWEPILKIKELPPHTQVEVSLDLMGRKKIRGTIIKDNKFHIDGLAIDGCMSYETLMETCFLFRVLKKGVKCEERV